MKCAVIYEPGGPEKFVIENRPVPELRPGWSLVRVRGCGLNHSEIFTRKGLSPSVSFPRVLGIECAGEIAGTTDPDRLPEGQRVISIMGEMGRAFDGGYTEYVLLPNEQIYPVDTDMSWEELSAAPETYYTAYGSLKNLKLRDGMSVLIRGATSGVGIAFLRLARSGHSGLRICGTTRSDNKDQLLIDAGFDEVIADVDGVIRTEETFDRVLELIGPKTIKDSIAHLNEDGIVCSVGQLGGQWCLEDFDPIMELANNVYLTTFYSGNVSEEKIGDMLRYIKEHDVDVRPEKVFSLDEISDAHRWMESTRSFGKVILLN